MRRDVGVCYLILVVVTGLGLFNMIPVSVHMIVAATAIIFIGAHGSVPLLQTDQHSFDAACAQCRDDQASGKSAANQPQAEQMQTKDAMMFPVYGSCVLFGLYLVFKLLPKEYVMIVLKAYFFVIGVLVLGHRIKVISSHFLTHDQFHAFDTRVFRIKWPKMPWDSAPAPAAAAANASAADAPATPAGGDANAVAPAPAAAVAGGEEVTKYDIVCYVVALAIGFAYLKFNHWALSNLFGVCFCIQGIELIGLGSYFNGTILLCGLFVYDVFWVFGTDVMVTVAKSFDAPIKLMFPQFVDPSMNPSMLGLGDIVIPGIFIALILRFDYTLRTNDAPLDQTKRTYFNTVMVAYVIGLLTTVLVMYWFEAAQPALLYLVPACLLGTLVPACLKRQYSMMWNFKEDAAPAAATTKQE